MSDVGKVTIETVARSSGIAHHVSAEVNVGGSLVDVQCDSEQDPELAGMVERLYAKLTSIALETVRASLHQDRS